MEVKDAVNARRARRALDTRPIPEHEVRMLVDAMRLSPSCNNNQPWRVVLAREPEALATVKAALTKGNVWGTRAPLIMAVCAKADDDCRLKDNRDYFLLGCGLALGEMVLQATELGIIAHPIGGYDPIAVKQTLGIPEEYVVITLVICGYRSTDTSLLSEKQLQAEEERPARKPVGENFFESNWGKPYSG